MLKRFFTSDNWAFLLCKVCDFSCRLSERTFDVYTKTVQNDVVKSLVDDALFNFRTRLLSE